MVSFDVKVESALFFQLSRLIAMAIFFLFVAVSLYVIVLDYWAES